MPLKIIRQDITKMRVDAIVNSTNENMIGYSGVDRLIHELVGKELDEECKGIAPLGLGSAKATRGYGLGCKHIIHTRAPIWQDGLHGEYAILRSCYVESMRLAIENGCSSVAFPLIGTGAYSFPKEQTLRFAVDTVTEFLFGYELDVYLCVYDRQSYSFSQALFEDIRSFINDAPDLSADMMLTSMHPDNAPPVLRTQSRRRTGLYEAFSVDAESLYDYVLKADKSFQEMLFDLIDKRGMTDVECYKKANVDKRTFSKIKSKKDYRPSKQTAVAFAIALKLSIDETQALLETVGMTLSRSAVFDRIIRYFIGNGVYDIFEINQALFEFDQVLLGSI